MIRYAVLGSGSSANSYIIQYTDESDNSSDINGGEISSFADIPDPNNKITIVIDNGFSLREFTRRASELNFKLEDINFIFLTHDHSDHLKGVATLSSRYDIPVVMGKDTCLKSQYSEKIFKTLIVEGGRDYSYNNLKFSVFRTFHDSDGSVGYSFNIKGTVFTIITDTGTISDEMEEHALESDVLFLEANYCPEMLENGPYPWFLKKRIASELGHLSNNDAVDFLKQIHDSDIENKERMTYLCHLSDKNNCSDKLDSLIKNNFKDDFNYRICRKGETVEGNPITIIYKGDK